MVSSFGDSSGILVVLNNNLGEVMKKIVIVTLESKIVSYSQFQNFNRMEKYII